MRRSPRAPASWPSVDGSSEGPSRRTLLRGTCAALATLALEGCRPQIPLRIGLHPWPANDLFFLAEHLGYYAGTEIRLVDDASAEQGLQSVRNGLLEAYPCTLDEALLLAADLPDVRIVQMLDSSFGADAIVARVDIPSLEGLRGRRVGYEATALGAYLLTRALQIAGLATDDVTPVFVGLDEHERALREGRVDAVVTYEPALGRLVAEGAHVLFDSTQIPGEIVDVLLVRGDVLDRRPDTLARVVTGWLRAASALRERPRESADALAPRLGVSVEQVPAAFATIRLSDLAENRKQILGTPPPIATAARRLMTTMLAAGILPRAPDVDRLFDGRVVARLSTPG